MVDVVVAALGLLLLIVPMVIIAVYIKLDSHGPLFFWQTRVGQFGCAFRICKFRTMFPHTELAGLSLTVSNDPRITSVGTILRKYKLDELPQIWNVLKGEMSLVGPRPEVPRYVAHYPPDVREIVLSLRPGITDLASIAFRNENELLRGSLDPEKTYLEEVLPVKLRYCVAYVRTRSLAMDVNICLKTLSALVLRTS